MENQKSLILRKVDQQKGNDKEGQQDIGKHNHSIFHRHFCHVIGKPYWNFPDARKGQKYQRPETIEEHMYQGQGNCRFRLVDRRNHCCHSRANIRPDDKGEYFA